MGRKMIPASIIHPHHAHFEQAHLKQQFKGTIHRIEILNVYEYNSEFWHNSDEA